MKFTAPTIPLWVIVLFAVVIGIAAIGGEVVRPRDVSVAALESHAGFYAAAGFAAALVALAGGRLVRLLRRASPDET